MREHTVTNIAAHLTVMAHRRPAQPAVVIPPSQKTRRTPPAQALTFQQLDEESDRLAYGFQTIGLRPGMRTALMVPPSLEFFALTFALFKLGAVPVLIDPGIGWRNLGKGLAQAAPEAFIGIPKAHIARALLRWAKKTITIRVTVGAFPPAGGTTLKAVRKLATHGHSFPALPSPPAGLAAILFTSGSTGPSKGVAYSHDYFAAQVEQVRRLYQIEPGEIDLPTFPLFALFGPALGMTEVLPEMDPTRPAQVDPAKIVAAIQNYSVTNLFGSPAVINRVGRFGAAHGVKLPTLKRVISAGAPVPAKVIERFASLLPSGAQVFTPYGATECLPVSSIGSAELLSETRAQTEQGKGVCIGFPVLGLAVKIIRISDEPISCWTDSLEAGSHEIGEIVVQGAHVTRAYYNDAAATTLAKILDPATGGFYHRMGDVGYFDQQGRLWFCGRKSQRVVTPQGTLFTIPCEAVFNTHPAVFRSALVGVQRVGHLEPVLCLELEPGLPSIDRAKLRLELSALAQAHPHTRLIKAFLVHPAFPVDIRHNAKIFREKLARWASRRA